MTIPTSDPYVLAIDLGTSGCKAALVSIKGHVAAWEFEPVEAFYAPGGLAEQRPDDWWDAFRTTAKKLIHQNIVPKDQIIAICCSTQGEGTVPVDRDGTPLMNCVLWQDSRGAENLKSIIGGPIKVAGYDLFKLIRYIRLTGGAPSLTGKDPASHMLLIRDSFPEVYEKTYKFLNVLDYMNLRLTGRYVATVDSILTSWVTDNRDLNNIHYHDGLIKNCGIDKDKLPEIIKCTDTVGELLPDVATELGLSPKTKIIAGAIDTSAAAVGSGAVRDYDPHIYLGTSSWICAHVPFKKTDISTSMGSVPCARPDKYLLIGLQATAGGNLTFLKEKVLYHKDELLQEEKLPDVYKIMDRIADRVPAGSNGVIYTPWIYGERAPVEDHTVRASIYNLSLENNRGDIIRAYLEGVALNTRWMLNPAEKFLGRKAEHIHIIGGGGSSDVWCQIFADVMNRTMLQPKDPIQANVRGAAFMAAYGLGHLEFDDIPDLIEYNGHYEPNPQHTRTYDDLFKEYVNIYHANKKIFKRLNRTRPTT